MMIYIQPWKWDSGYTVATGIPKVGEDYTTKVIAWFKTMKEAIEYAEYLISNHPVGAYTEILIGKEKSER